MRSPIWLILHDPKSTTGTTERWCVEKGIGFEIVQAPELKTDELPDAAIIFGGDMQVWETEKYPWLSREKAFVAQMLNADKPILGLCLGAQLIAEQLGGEVTDMGMDVIGWFPVQTDEETILPFHCHSSKFSLPAGTVRIAGDEMINQGFRKFGHQVGLQFHAEMDRPRLAHALEK